MPQLVLFEGSHLPRTAARQALSRGDLREAHAQLRRLAGVPEEAADAARLEQIDATLGAASGASVEAVHDAFQSALSGSLSGDAPRGFLSDAEWFGLYGQRAAAVLADEPGRRFRGWLGAHFAFVTGEPGAARSALERILELEPPGATWIAAARLAFALGGDALAARARGSIHSACLESRTELRLSPPVLEPCGVPALDCAPPLPPFPEAVEDVIEATRALAGLPDPWTRWVPVVGEIDRVLAPTAPPRADDRDEEPASESPAADTDTDAPRAFLAALRAARRSRERDRPGRGGGCSDRELRARRRMQRLAPELLARYLQGLGGALF